VGRAPPPVPAAGIRRRRLQYGWVRRGRTYDDAQVAHVAADDRARPGDEGALEEQWEATHYRADSDLVFGHPHLATPLDPSKLSRDYMRPALQQAKIEKPVRVWHDIPHGR
jgi:hypothetical protein